MDRYVHSDQERAILEGLQQPFAVYQFIDGQVVTLLLSDGFCELFGYTDRERALWDMDHDMYKFTHPDDRKRIIDVAMRFAREQSEYEVVYRSKAGAKTDYRVVHAIGKHVYTPTGVRLAHVWYMDEGVYIEGNESAGTRINRELNSILHEETILRTINYDALTGLPNLAYFFKLCENGMTEVVREDGRGCLLYLDLYGMKYYNYRNGFAEGDKLLKAFADLLAQTFGREMCCHISADRFAAATTVDGLDDRLRQLFDAFEQMENHLSVRVGVYPTSIEDVPISSAYDRAKLACDAIQKTDESKVSYYTKSLSDQNKRRAYIQTHIDRAISNEWISVYYQPIVRAVNERVCDEEALARWIDPELGFLSPAEFIPELEESGQIYKLDLYVLEQVLKKIKREQASGLNVVPHSVNLSRSDFDSCDIVEEIRNRVDAAGVRRDLITIEITESVIGSNLDFMKGQIKRFRQLGFPVWMDDFGSGYSSLDVLQSIQFDLIKFDMSFMRRLDQGDNARIVLTELMKLVASLGVESVCEGVETQDQVRLLQEIGCSKLQGFHYSKPVPLDELLERRASGQINGFEDPLSASYFELIGRINVFDLDSIASREEEPLQDSFSTVPVGVIEVRGDAVRCVRSNPSYREFVNRYLGIDIQSVAQEFIRIDLPFIDSLIENCSKKGGRAILDETMSDGSVVHFFARRIGVNPQTGDIAIAVAILSVGKPNEELVVERILTVIEQFGEHVPGGFFIYKADDREELLYANEDVWDIFGCTDLEDFKEYSGFTFRSMVHPDDYEAVSESITQQIRTSDSDLDSVEYRIIRKDGQVRWIDDYGQYMESEIYHGLFFVFISDVTDKHLQAESDKALRSAVIEALTRPFDSVWLIKDFETQEFELYRVDEKTVHLTPAFAAAKIQKFSDALTFYAQLVLEEDRARFLDSTTPEAILKHTEDKLVYAVPFRRVFEDGVRHYRVEFSRMELDTAQITVVAGFRDMD